LNWGITKPIPYGWEVFVYQPHITKTILIDMSKKGDFMIDHDNKKAILWATNAMEYAVLLQLMGSDINALGYELISYIQPERPNILTWED
jgi:hypothetical protein